MTELVAQSSDFPSAVQITMVINTLFATVGVGTALLLSNSKTSYTKRCLPHSLEPSASPKLTVINVMAME